MTGFHIRNLCSMFMVSAGTLAFEVILTRLFSLTFWHHFASLLIALALIGFGTAGSLLAVVIPGLKKHEAFALAVSALAASLAMLFGYLAVLAVGLEPLALAWAGRPWLDLGLVCLILVVPFLLSASHIGLILARTEKINLAYAFNLTGSGAGCLVAALSLIYLLPNQALYPAAGLTMLGFGVQALGCARRVVLPMVLIAVAACLLVFLYPVPLHYEPFKDRSAVLAAQGSRVEQQAVGLRGVIEIIGGPAFHFAPGLSLSCSALLPPQRGLFLDGDLVGPITKVGFDSPIPAFVRCLLTHLAYHVVSPGKVLVLNPGGGLGLLTALHSGVNKIVGLEENPQLFDLMTGSLAGFNGDLYRRPQVQIIKVDPLFFLRRTQDRFNLIVLGQGTRWESGSASGLGVSRFLTVDGLSLILNALTTQGALAITGPLMHPPRASIRLLATAAQALRDMGVDSKSGLVLASDWNTVLLLVKPRGFTPDEIKRLMAEASKRGFDLPYLPGGSSEELNRFHRLPGQPLLHGAEMILAGRAEELFDRNSFHLNPATRDRPYFFNFYRLRTLSLIINLKDSSLLSVTEWGLLFTWGGLVAALLIAGAGIFLPLFRLGPRPPGLIFFSLIGLGYMMAEITLLAETIYHLGHPAQAIPLVIGIFLMLSGVGSFLWGLRPPRVFTLASAAALVLAFFILRFLPGGAFGVGLLLAPAALLMGVPFAGGLTHLVGPEPSIRAWAYGVNGFFSVVGSLAATLICLQLGHLIAILTAGGCYLLAGLVSRGGRS
ncbi:MAG: hypothetical protein JRI54_02995 [Deltaproteobacteria bacterium]|nr:hypothetical protein [Deltaproteobacteria bacterium]